jgi:hypothetical protein
MINILPGIHNESGGFNPGVVKILSDDVCKELTGIVIGYELWVFAWCSKEEVNQGEYLADTFTVIALSPANRHSTGPLDGLKTINVTCLKVWPVL